MPKLTLIFDIETNGIDPDTIWMVAAETPTGDKFFYTDHESGFEPLLSFKDLFNKADVLVGHNIIGYDLPVLERLTGWTPRPDQKIIDTMLLSQMNDFDRPQFNKFLTNRFGGRHNMKIWSKFLGGEEKHEDPSWEEYSVEMRERCVSDVSINVTMYRYMAQEAKQITAAYPTYKDALRLEHEVATVMAAQERGGWLVDFKELQSLKRTISERMSQIQGRVEPHLPPVRRMIDKAPREARRLANGQWDKVTREWFGDEPVVSPYQRYKMVDGDLGKNESVIAYLYDNGWKPTEWNWTKGPDREWIKGAPKLTEDSYESINGEIGEMIAEWRVLRSRKSFLEGLEKVRRGDNRVACRAFTIGTNTHRMRHAGIVNVPGAYAKLGQEVRSLFIAAEGRSLVSCDSDSNQLRALAHYLNDAGVTESIVRGDSNEGTDIHSRNAKAIGVERNIAKNVIYALAFGAGDVKLGTTAEMPGKGKQLRARLESSMPGLQKLIDNVKDHWELNQNRTGRGFVIGLDGRRIYCERYKAFNALLQGFEAVTCKAAVVNAWSMIQAEGLDATPTAMIHDEVTFDVADKDAARVAEILEYSFGDFLTITYKLNAEMGGSASIGANWYEVH